MGGLGAFLNAFGATTMHYQDQAQDMQKFQLGLQMQQAQLAMQQMQFERTMHNRDLVRQDALKQHEMENALAQQAEQRKTIEGQSQIEARNRAAARDDQQLEVNTAGVVGQLSPEQSRLRARIQAGKEEGLDTSADEAQLRDIEAQLAKAKGDQPAGAPQAAPQGQAAAPAGASSSSGMLTGAEPAAEPQGPSMSMGGPGQAAPPAQPMGAQQPAGPVPTPPAFERQGPTMAMAAKRGVNQPQLSKTGIKTKYVPTKEEADAKNAQDKANGITFRHWVGLDEVDKATRQQFEDKVKTQIAQGDLIASNPGEWQDVLNQNGVELEVAATPKQMVRAGFSRSARVGGSLFGPLAAAGSQTGGTSETKMPKVSFMPKGAASILAHNESFIGKWFREKDLIFKPDSAEKLVAAIIQKAESDPQLNGEAPESIVQGAKDVIRLQKNVVEQLRGEDKNGPIKREPFATWLQPDLSVAAKLAESGKRAENGLEQVSALPYQRVEMPAVVDTDRPTNQVLGMFGQVVGSQQQGGFGYEGRDLSMPREQQDALLTELTMRLRPDLPDGSYSEASKIEAMKAWEATKASNGLSPEFKQGVFQALKPIITQQITEEGRKAEAQGAKYYETPEQTAEKKFGKQTSQAESAGGTGGIRGMVTLAALGMAGGTAKSQEPKAKPAAKVPPTPQKAQDAAAVSSELSSVKAAQDRPARAKQAAETISSTWGRLSETEKSTVRKQWATQRGTWKSYGVSEETLKKLDALIGKEKSRADQVNDAAREIDALTKNKKG